VLQCGMKPYTYLNLTKDGNEIFYVGAGTGKRSRAKKYRNIAWMDRAANGFTATIVAHWDTMEEAYQHEILLISCFKDMGLILTNVADGGPGACGTKGNKGTKWTQPQRDRMSQQRKGKLLGPRKKHLVQTV
jgi:hypothetical protein